MNRELAVTSVDGGIPWVARALPDNWPRSISGLDWAPTRDELLLSGYVGPRRDSEEEDHDLFVVSPSGRTRLEKEPCTTIAGSWNPTGTSLVASSDRAGTFDLYKMDLRGRTVTRLTGGHGDDLDAAWSR